MLQEAKKTKNQRQVDQLWKFSTTIKLPNYVSHE